MGRLASNAAALLMGKNQPTFNRNVASTNTVLITNASKLKVTAKKLLQKKYTSYSGYPGGLREQSMAHLVEKKGYREALTHAIKGMLPDNKLKKEFLKHLTVTE